LNVNTLEKAGFTQAAQMLAMVQNKQRRLLLAYEFYRYVTPEHIEAFQIKLMAAGIEVENPGTSNVYHRYAQLVFTPIEAYTGQGNKQGLPPQEVIDAVIAANDRAIFDSLEVAYVATVREYKDPIIFGRIDGCGDRFYICQWGDDVAITDLLLSNEG
jgi:hypothetical protein